MHVPLPIRGPVAPLMRLFGIRISRMNPNLCTMCETHFQSVKKEKQKVVPATVLFADLRGYTPLSERLGEARTAKMLECFYDVCSAAVWEHEGIVNKFLGDAVLAVFGFPILRDDHAMQAVLAGLDIQRGCREQKALLVEEAGGVPVPVGVGVGVHTGEASMGEVGTAYRDFTIVGPVVNTAARLQSAAATGEILVTEAVYSRVSDLAPGAEPRTLSLKGIDHPVKAHRLLADAVPSRP
jgi:adenylate cyclase